MLGKYITLLAILFSWSGKTLTEPQNVNVLRYVSVDSDIYEAKFETKITKEEIKYCQNSHTVNLDDMNLKAIKNDIVKSDIIQQISLEKNHLENVPNNILDNVPHLACLHLRQNRINLYNGDAVSMRHYYLRVLDLSDQEMYSEQVISEIEDTTEQIDGVYKYMIFNSSGMSLPHLEHLDLSKNDISAILWSFNTSFPRLTHLHLTNIYADKVEPSFFDKIPSTLQTIYLENNQFRDLTLKNAMNITAIYLDGNTKLRNIEIVSSKLRILSLSNCFKELGNIVLNTPYLEQLDLTKNNLHTMSQFHFEVYQTLQILLLDNNKLEEMPFLNLRRLVELSINDNMIRYILPNTFMYLSSLKKLSLRGNDIESIKGDIFLGLRKLEYLDLSINKLRILPYNWLMPMINLQYLNVISNQFTNISDIGITYPINSNTYLKHLFVKNNKFSVISMMDLLPLPPSITVYLA